MDAKLEQCKRLAEALQTKGVKAYFGSQWDGHTVHDDLELFWYFYPSSGDIGVYVQYNSTPYSHTYDAGFISWNEIPEVIELLKALHWLPSRECVWKVLEGSLT